MRIGLFTDTYKPSINGIVFVAESLKTQLESMGHEVYVFCPAKSIRPSKHADILQETDHFIRFPSVKGAFYDDYDTSLFFPPMVLRKIRQLDLDIIHVLTPGQVGLIGIQSAWKTDTPFIIQHCTDIYEFSEHYPATLPGALALVGLVVPFTVKLKGKDIRELAKLYRPRRGATVWNKDIIEKTVTVIYSKADAVITLSRKSKAQLESWQSDEVYRYPLIMLPNGVDALPKATLGQINEFREKFGIAKSDEVFGFVGRLGEEKNLPILIDTLGIVLQKRKNARLLFVGDFEYRETLEKIAKNSGFGDRVTFTGALPRETLGVVYKSMQVFTFPSLKDTQGWVLHEAAHAGLPVVIIDRDLSEVVVDGQNGYIVANDPQKLAETIADLLKNSKKRALFGAESKKLALKFTERRQMKKLEKLYQNVIKNHVPHGKSSIDD